MPEYFIEHVGQPCFVIVANGGLQFVYGPRGTSLGVGRRQGGQQGSPGF